MTQDNNMLGFTDFLASNDITKNMYDSGFSNQERAGMLTSYKNLQDTNQLGITIGAGQEYLRNPNIPDGGFNFTDFLGSKGFENGLGAANLGMGILGYLDDKKTAKAQRNLMGQQARANDWAYNKQVANSAALGKAFGTA